MEKLAKKIGTMAILVGAIIAVAFGGKSLIVNIEEEQPKVIAPQVPAQTPAPAPVDKKK